MLYYQASEVGVELHVTRTSPGRHTVLGQVIGATTTEVQVTEVQVQVESESESPGRLATVPIDDLGRFHVDDLPAGRFRVRLVGPHRPPITTAWTLV
jgi:hypothetical protein